MWDISRPSERGAENSGVLILTMNRKMFLPQPSYPGIKRVLIVGAWHLGLISSSLFFPPANLRLADVHDKMETTNQCLSVCHIDYDCARFKQKKQVQHKSCHKRHLQPDVLLITSSLIILSWKTTSLPLGFQIRAGAPGVEYPHTVKGKTCLS